MPGTLLTPLSRRSRAVAKESVRALIAAAVLTLLPSCVEHVDAASLVMPPNVPQPAAPGDLVGFILQNPTASAAPTRIVTFGQAFADQAVPAGATLLAKGINDGEPVQMDIHATYPDGSVRFAAITLVQPPLAAGQSVAGLLALSSAPSAAPVNLAPLVPNLTVALTPGNPPGGITNHTIDLGAPLRQLVAYGKPLYWLQGPLATQARVDVNITGTSLHVTADITGYADGSVAADVQFNNDLAMTSAGGTVGYNTTITLNRAVTSFANITQYQYQDWHVVLTTNGASPINVQHDPAQLERIGAILPYDLTTGVADATLQSYAAYQKSTPNFGAPLSPNGVTQSMPATGGRPDIGFTTQYNTVWLITQDARAASFALAQGDAAGAVPWNMKLAGGAWLTPAAYPNIWTDPRGGAASYTTGLTQPTSYPTAGWSPDPAHQPDLAYVPYLMTGTRWYLDRLNAQAAFSETVDWPGYRCKIAACDIVVNGMDQVRQQAWSLREIVEAAWIGVTGTADQSHFVTFVQHNNAWMTKQVPSLTSTQGQAHGWLPGDYGNLGATAPWEQDYFAGIAVLSAEMGFGTSYVNFIRNFSEGRFTGARMNPHDGCTYNLETFDPNTLVPFTTWSAIEQATVAANASNGTGWQQSVGDYCALARSALGGLLTITPSDTGAAQALSWLNAAGAPHTDAASFQSDPTFNVVPMQ